MFILNLIIFKTYGKTNKLKVSVCYDMNNGGNKKVSIHKLLYYTILLPKNIIKHILYELPK